MRRSVVLATSEFLSLTPTVQRADALGFTRIWTTETPTRDSLVRALALGLQTRRIGWASGIAYAFTRAPLAMAANASDVNTALDGRFSLGIGAGTRGMRQHWFGVDDFDHPASRLAEYAALLRAAWASPDTLHFDGTFYRSDFDQLQGPRPAVPIWGSGVNPTMLTVAGRHFDGVALHPLAGHLRYLEDVALPAIARGAARRTSLPELACWKITSIDDDGFLARRRAKSSLAMYFSTPSYGVVARHAGWGDVAAEVQLSYKEFGPRWNEVAAVIPEALVEEFCLAGTPAEVAKQWAQQEERLSALGIDEVVFQTALDDEHSGSASSNLAAIVETLAPPNDATRGL